MTHAELIAEADKEAKRQDKLYATAVVMALAKEAGEYAECRNTLRRLAAALRECAVPAGWIITRYDNTDRGAVELDDGVWHVGHYEDEHAFIFWRTDTFPTASAAMAALDGDGK